MLVSEMTFLQDHWYPVAVAESLTGPRPIQLLGAQYVVWPTGDGSFAVSDAYCPHRSAHLSGGWVDDGQLVCPYHGWRFDGSGTCTHIPQLDAHLPTPPRATLRTYPAVEQYGMVWTCIGDEPAEDAPPVWQEAELGWRLYVEFFEEWQVAAPRIVDNNLDQSHVAYVHMGTFGDPGRATMPHVDITPNAAGGFSSQLASTQPGVGVQLGVTDDETRCFDRIGEVELLAPLTTRTRLYYGEGTPDYAFFSTAVPIDDSRSMYMRLALLSGTEEQQPWAPFDAFGTRVKEEDRIILESTLDDFPVDIVSEVHLRCDKVTLEYRKYLTRQLAPTPVRLRATA